MALTLQQMQAELDMAARQAELDQFFGMAVSEPADPTFARTLGAAVKAGLQSSATGLAVRGALPDVTVPEDAPWYHRIAAGGAGLAADLPLSIVGAVGGGAAGSAVAPGVGTLLGAGAGGFGVPMAVRDALVTAYGQGSARTWSDVWEIAKSGLTGGGKGAVIGGATLGAGRLAKGVLMPSAVHAMKAGAIGAKTARAGVVGGMTAAELTALTVTAAGMEGRLPAAHEFMDNAILLGGLKGAVAIAGKLREIYAETGKPPAEIVAEAQRNPELKAAIIEGAELPKAMQEAAIQQRVDAALAADPGGKLILQRLREVERGEGKNLEQMANEPPALRMDYLYDSMSLKATERLIEQHYAREIEKQTRGVVSVERTKGAAKLTSPLGEHVIGTTENARQMVVRGAMLREAAAEFTRVRDELLTKPEAEVTQLDMLKFYAATESLKNAHLNYRGAGAELGRAMHIMRTMKYNKEFLKDVEGFTKEVTKDTPFAEVLALAKALKDPEQAARFAEQMTKSTTMEKVIEAWKAAILSGPLTQLANIMGNTMKLMVEIPESVIRATMTAARRKKAGDPMSLEQWKAHAFAPIIGWKLGARDAMAVAWEVMKGVEEPLLEKADQFKHAIPGKAGHAIRTPFRALQAFDVIFRTPAERAKAYEMAVDRAIAEKYMPGTKEFAERVAKYTTDPTLGLEAEAGATALTVIKQAGAEAVFAQRLGPRLEMAQASFRGSPVEFAIPFVRTPANLVSWAVQHTPFLNFISPRWRADYAAGGVRRDMAVAKVLVGVGLMSWAYQWIQDGQLSGGGMFDPEQRRTKTAAGWQPYSIKIGDTWYSYQRIEPVAKVIGIVADIMEMYDKSEDDDRFKLFIAALAMFGNATISTTYLQGTAGVFNALTDPERYAESWYEQYAASLVPKIIGQPVQLLDPHKREVEGFLESIQAQLPYFRQKLLPQRDVWGDEKPNMKALGILPIAKSKETDDKVKQEAVRLELAIAPVPKGILSPGPFPGRDRKIELEPEQRDYMARVSGAFAMEILRPMVNDPAWDRIPDFAKATIFKAVIEASRKRGRIEAMPADAQEREVKRQEIIQKIERDIEKATKPRRIEVK